MARGERADADHDDDLPVGPPWLGLSELASRTRLRGRDLKRAQAAGAPSWINAAGSRGFIEWRLPEALSFAHFKALMMAVG